MSKTRSSAKRKASDAPDDPTSSGTTMGAATRPRASAKPKAPSQSKSKPSTKTAAAASRAKIEKETMAASLSPEPKALPQEAQLPTPPGTLPRPGALSLDPASYPHLFDEILRDHSTSDLMSLRSASRALRERVDARLARHLVIKFKTKEKDSVHVVPHAFEGDYRFSALRGSYGQLAHWRPYFPYTRALDLCGAVAPHISAADAAALDRLQTLRIRGTASPDADYSNYVATTVVILAGPTYGYRPPVASRLPLAARKFVLTLAWRPHDESPRPHCILKEYDLDASKMEEIVLVLDKRHEKKLPKHLNGFALPETIHLWSFYTCLRETIKRGIATKLVNCVQYLSAHDDFVEPALMSPPRNGLDPPQYKAACEALVRAAIRSIESNVNGLAFSGGLHSEPSETAQQVEVDALTSCLDTEEYRELVGQEAFAVETVA